VSDARPYHHGDLRSALVAKGLELTRADGPDALVLRDVTRAVGVSPNAVYRHFANRQALLDAVAAAILARVANGMATEQATGSAPRMAVERLRAVGLGYIAFARREPGWFSVVFFGRGGGRDVSTAPPYLALADALDGMVAAGVLTGARRAGAEWSCWAAVHGFAVLMLDGPLGSADESEVQRLAARTVDAIIDGVIGQNDPPSAAADTAQRSASEPAMPPSEK
jgi:AcrR family transcriptional regulator